MSTIIAVKPYIRLGSCLMKPSMLRRPRDVVCDLRRMEGGFRHLPVLPPLRDAEDFQLQTTALVQARNSAFKPVRASFTFQKDKFPGVPTGSSKLSKP